MKALSAIRVFLRNEAASGVVLLAATAAALLVANLPDTGASYAAMLHQPVGPMLVPKLGPMTIHLWINDALMTLFFLTVGLEIKRELIDGQLSRRDQRLMPFVAAVAGMAVPALVYLVLAGGDPALRRGWAIPAATDIAFATGVMALAGRRVPAALKLLLTTIAIVDDMGAVAIIALVYTEAIALPWLGGAAAMLAVLAVLNRRGVRALSPYLIVAAALWLFVLKSGVHATIAGVLAAAFIPLDRSPGAPDAAGSPLHRLEHALHPWVAFGVVPLFAFANAGVALHGIGVGTFGEPLVLGIVAGLVVGKQAGILAALAMTVRFGLARLPSGVGWRQLWGMSLIAGIGFTMSLFVGGLAFPDEGTMASVKIGVLAGSLLAALGGYAVLRFGAARD